MAGYTKSTRGAKARGVRSLPPRRSGKSKIVRSNPMAHGGNC